MQRTLDKNWQELKKNQYSHRYEYAKLFNVELHKIAKKAQQGKEIKWDLFLLTMISALVIPYIRKELSSGVIQADFVSKHINDFGIN